MWVVLYGFISQDKTVHIDTYIYILACSSLCIGLVVISLSILHCFISPGLLVNRGGYDPTHPILHLLLFFFLLFLPHSIPQYLQDNTITYYRHSFLQSEVSGSGWWDGFGLVARFCLICPTLHALSWSPLPTHTTLSLLFLFFSSYSLYYKMSKHTNTHTFTLTASDILFFSCFTRPRHRASSRPAPGHPCVPPAVACSAPPTTPPTLANAASLHHYTSPQSNAPDLA